MTKGGGALYYLMPDEIHRTIFDIDLHALWGAGYRSLLLDVDNTLLPWNDTAVPERVALWARVARGIGFDLVLFSNNGKERLLPVGRALSAPFLAKAKKPSPASVRRALALIGAAPKQAALVGDQLLTDIWAGKRAGVYTILVRPLSAREFLGTRVNRVIEKALLNRMGVDRL